MIDMGLTGEGDHYVILLKAAAYLLKKTAEAESAEFPNESNYNYNALWKELILFRGQPS